MRQNNFFSPNQNNFALAQQNQVPSSQFISNAGNFQNRPLRQQTRPNFNQNQFVNQGFQQRPNNFRQPFNNNNQFNSFQSQQQQQQQQFQNQIQTTRQTFSSSSTATSPTPAPTVRTSVTTASSSPVPVFSTVQDSSPISPIVTTSVASTTRPPRQTTRQPRILASTANPFSSVFNTQRPRGGRAGHGDHDDGGNGYVAPPAPDHGYAPPSDYGHKPSFKILKLTGLDTAPLPDFNYMFSTENKINVMAEGELRNICNEDVTVMKGSYDYYGPDGVKYTVDWYADETGKF